MGSYYPKPMIPNMNQLTAMDARNPVPGYLCVSIVEHRYELPNMTRPPISVVIKDNTPKKIIITDIMIYMIH